MHWNVEQILWALVLASHLVLLVVLLGREHSSRFPWFTAAIVLSTIRLLADHLLNGKLTTVAFYWQSYVGMALDAIFALLVLIELSRAVFSSGKAGRRLKAKGWFGWSIVALIVAAAIVWAWGRPWPTWTALRADPAQFPLLLTVAVALKISLFASLLTVETGLLMRIFGKRFGFGWKSHAQQIVLGLSTNAIGVLAVQAIEDMIRHNIHFTTLQERNELAERIGRIFGNLENARVTLWTLVLVWWIAWLWREEPGAAAPVEGAEPVLASPQVFEAEIPEDGDPDFRD